MRRSRTDAAERSLLASLIREEADAADETRGEHRWLKEAAWFEANDAFRLVSETRGEGGVRPRDFPNAGLAHQGSLHEGLKGVVEPTLGVVPLFFEGPHPTVDGARAGALVVPYGLGPRGVVPRWYAALPPGAIAAISVTPYEELPGSGRGERPSWIVGVGASGHVLAPAGGELVLRRPGAGEAEVTDLDSLEYRVHGPVLDCALFCLCALNAFALRHIVDVRPVSRPRGMKRALFRRRGPFGAGGYALDTRDLADILVHVGEARSSGLAAAMAHPSCRRQFFGRGQEVRGNVR